MNIRIFNDNGVMYDMFDVTVSKTDLGYELIKYQEFRGREGSSVIPYPVGWLPFTVCIFDLDHVKNIPGGKQ